MLPISDVRYFAIFLKRERKIKWTYILDKTYLKGQPDLLWNDNQDKKIKISLRTEPFA